MEFYFNCNKYNKIAILTTTNFLFTVQPSELRKQCVKIHNCDRAKVVIVSEQSRKGQNNQSFYNVRTVEEQEKKLYNLHNVC